jgi:hypothetical protein
MVRSEGNMSLKKPVTPPGIDPGTVRLLAQHLNHYVTPGHYATSIKRLKVCNESLNILEIAAHTVV